jgi:hypothetical protein
LEGDMMRVNIASDASLVKRHQGFRIATRPLASAL